jgi:hypothetical protein
MGKRERGFETKTRKPSPEIRIPFLGSPFPLFAIFLEVAQRNETMETSETSERLFFKDNQITSLACGKK